MIVEVMKVAQQPAMAYDKVPHSTPAKYGKSGLLLNSSYVSPTRSLALLERADASFGEGDLLDFSVSARSAGSWSLERSDFGATERPSSNRTWSLQTNDRSGLPCQP